MNLGIFYHFALQNKVKIPNFLVLFLLLSAVTLFRKARVPGQSKLLIPYLTPAVEHVRPILEVLGYHLIETAIIVPDQELKH